MIERKPFRWSQVGGRDIFFDAECTCPDRHIDILRHKIKLAGYADANFFDNVNREPTHDECECGRKYTYQWFRNGVEFQWLDEKSIADCFADIRSDLAEIMAS
jgi:hypothetical protein